MAKVRGCRSTATRSGFLRRPGGPALPAPRPSYRAPRGPGRSLRDGLRSAWPRWRCSSFARRSSARRGLSSMPSFFTSSSPRRRSGRSLSSSSGSPAISRRPGPPERRSEASCLEGRRSAVSSSWHLPPRGPGRLRRSASSSARPSSSPGRTPGKSCRPIAWWPVEHFLEIEEIELNSEDRTVTVVGSGGDGVITFGDLLAQAAAHVGLHVVETDAYGAQIRGGEASATVRIASGEISAPGDAADIVVVLRWDDFERFRDEIEFAPGAVVLHEPPADGAPVRKLGPDVRLFAIPFAELSRTSAGSPSARNIVALGVVSQLLGLSPETIRAAVSHRFRAKGAERME